ncbi:MAG: DUF4249 domain-containing protein [Crocinitomicaceae bacterium]|nr:DUF4249 domain-containing protein [Crocinitomicaceae bacterium]
MKKTVSTIILFILIMISITSCSKEVKIDIPGYKEQLVVDGNITTGMPPIVILSKSKDIYSPTSLDAFLSGFVKDASVFVSDGTNEYPLTLLCSNDLPPGTEDLVAGFLGITPEQLSLYNVCAYTSLNSAIWGQVGKNYKLRIQHEGKEYTGSTALLTPVSLDSLWWKEDNKVPGFGYSYGRLTDNGGTWDAYNWEVKRINQINGKPIDSNFKAVFNSAFDDEFFNGKTFDFSYENPLNIDDKEIDKKERGFFKYGDTVVVKFSKIDKGTYDFLFSKMAQSMSNGNPFASPINVKTNLKGGCLGVWAGYSPIYDTLICN